MQDNDVHEQQNASARKTMHVFIGSIETELIEERFFQLDLGLNEPGLIALEGPQYVNRVRNGVTTSLHILSQGSQVLTSPVDEASIAD